MSHIRMTTEAFSAHQARVKKPQSPIPPLVAPLTAEHGDGGARSTDQNGLLVLLPFPPSANRYWRHANGRTYVSEQAKAYRKAVAAACGVRTPLQGELAVKLSFDYPDRRKRDLDNLAKQVLDSLQLCGAIEDDSQIVQLLLVRNSIQSKGEAECLVRIEVIES